ncbi:MAG TPA: hypothetical protein VGD10_11930 [Allosphingosinicella sp.]|uniref:hypothetical protein n=1 Tax=Allosphingosinicella sp. TaxID=2823234 RepID=UPI002EDB2868
MGDSLRQPSIDEAFERIEETILPSISMMLDTLLDAATLGKPGVDADIYAAELRTIGLQLEELTRQVEAMSLPRNGDSGYRAASVA